MSDETGIGTYPVGVLRCLLHRGPDEGTPAVKEPIHAPIVVTGFGRCGTTAMMRALRSGGLTWHPLLHDQTAEPPVEKASDAISPGTVTKMILDRAEAFDTIPDDALVILLFRDPEQQAKSQLKMLTWAGHLDGHLPAAQRDTFERGIASDTRRLQRLAEARDGRLPGTVLTVSFEDLVRGRRATMTRVGEWLTGHGISFDAVPATRSIHTRRVTCLPDMRVETLYSRLGA